MIRSVLLDIEGTVGPISFVHEVLFPYALERLRDFVLERFEDPNLDEIIKRLYREYEHEIVSAPAWSAVQDMEGAVSYLKWLMDQDRKSSGLKSVQGLIWQAGFENGELRGALYPDVPIALKRWKGGGVRAYVYSSGSVLAQQLYFRHSEYGDLSECLSGYFDTETGSKREAASYRRIAESNGIPAGETLFVSDVVQELDAAHDAGMDVRLALRPGNRPVEQNHWATIQTLSDCGI